MDGPKPKKSRLEVLNNDLNDDFTAEEFDMCLSQAVVACSQAEPSARHATVLDDVSMLPNSQERYQTSSDSQPVDRGTVYFLEGRIRTLRVQLAASQKELFALKTATQATESKRLVEEKTKNERLVKRLTSDLQFKEHELRTLKDQLFSLQHKNSTEIPSSQGFVKPRIPAIRNNSFIKSRPTHESGVQTNFDNCTNHSDKDAIAIFRVTRRPQRLCGDAKPLIAFAGCKISNSEWNELLIETWLKEVTQPGSRLSEEVVKAVVEHVPDCLAKIDGLSPKVVEGFLKLLTMIEGSRGFLGKINWRDILKSGNASAIFLLLRVVIKDGISAEIANGPDGFCDVLRKYIIDTQLSTIMYKVLSEWIVVGPSEIRFSYYFTLLAQEVLRSLYFDLPTHPEDVMVVLNACCTLNDEFPSTELEGAISSVVLKLEAYSELQEVRANIVELWPYTTSEPDGPADTSTLENVTGSSDDTGGFIIETKLGLGPVQIDYDAHVNIMSVGPTIHLSGKSGYISIDVAIVRDGNTNEVYLPVFKIDNFMSVSIEFTEMGVLTWLATALTKPVTYLFNSLIRYVVETSLRDIIESQLNTFSHLIEE